LGRPTRPQESGARAPVPWLAVATAADARAVGDPVGEDVAALPVAVSLVHAAFGACAVAHRPL
jgi:hypothetical protein